MIRTENRIRICTGLLILNLAFIWGNSLLPGSVSGAFSDWVKELLMRLLPGGDEIGPEGGGLLRKLAHFTEFATLGILLAWMSAMRKRHGAMALLLGAAAACVDETIQMFVPDRGPSLWDVGIDTCGVITGMIVLHLGYFLWRKNQFTLFGGKQQ